MKLNITTQRFADFITTLIMFYLFVFLNTDTVLHAQKNNNVDYNFHLGYSNLVFQDIDPRDGNAALLVYANQLENRFFQKHRTKIALSAKIYYSFNDIRNALKNNEIDLLSVPTDQFFELKAEFNLVPCLATFSSNEKFTQYVIISSSKAGISKTADMKGKSFTIPKSYNGWFVEKWINVFLYQNKLKSIAKCFSKVTNSSNEKSAVYDVFFGKTDCAVIRKSVLYTLFDFNPQLRNSIIEISQSPEVIPSILVYNKNSVKELVYLIIQESVELPTTPQGRKILEIFKASKVGKIDIADLENVKRILSDFNNIKVNPD